MPQNLELKARIDSMAACAKIARRIGAKRSALIRQKDTYFRIPGVRLKIREQRPGRSELILYRRSNRTGARFSAYTVYPANRELKDLLSKMYVRDRMVIKSRIVYLYKNARIHLDRVRGLGLFLEFEVLVTKGKEQAAGLMKELRREFQIAKGDVIGGSYKDLRGS
ncbi:MAG TPA: class IV adenylate cyclase [Bacteroidota bacterium]|nr:class IV adenylate cyclase [Bacteroidota bacterium]